ncbi:MAG TPA: TonB family protein [Tahibacter sp.]|uniref:energy transducer TonB n=1 Tax=Tahibacter sp. TaxID=2056211 RepID=UPI002BF71793|nr:TonB family protein [Tahibacter sp.]HSX62406.1 TonB family protein [Tahibacter sp.]
MPSSPSNAAQVLLLAPSEAASAAVVATPGGEDELLVPAGPAPRRPALFALLLSLALHVLAGALLWQWTTDIAPKPESPVLQVRLRAGGGKPAPAPLADQPPAPPAPVAATPKPQRLPAPVPAPPPSERAKTATLPTAPPVVASQEPAPVVPASTATTQADTSGTDVVTPPEDPLVNTATMRVLEWLAQHRRYPGPARRARLQGTVEIVVVLMPDGRLVDQRIAQSSGHAILDKAALDLLRRASPVPVSAFFTGEARQLELRLPIIYRLSI